MAAKTQEDCLFKMFNIVQNYKGFFFILTKIRFLKKIARLKTFYKDDIIATKNTMFQLLHDPYITQN